MTYILDLSFWYFNAGTTESTNTYLAEYVNDFFDSVPMLSSSTLWDNVTKDDVENTFNTESIFRIMFSNELTSEVSAPNAYKLNQISSTKYYTLPNKVNSFLDGSYLKLTDTKISSITGDSMLKDETQEISLLQALLDSKKYKYGTDPAIINLPLTSTDINDYVNNFNNLSMLSKSLFIHIYYLFNEQDDSFSLYQQWLTELKPFFDDENVNSIYKLIIIIYSSVIQNDIYKNLLDKNENIYKEDYWSND